MRTVFAVFAFRLAAGCSTSTPAPEAPPVKAEAPLQAPPAAEPRGDSKAAVAALVGTTPPEWRAERWMNATPHTLASMRGKVLLVRWWTAGCPFCSTTAPALRAFHETYAAQGLAVMGMYHHKEETPFDPKVYEATAKQYGFTFPVAFDPEWHTLDSWLKDRDGKKVDPGWTSVTFLLDKRGVIRHVHPGGSYVEGEPGHAEMKVAIEKLLAER